MPRPRTTPLQNRLEQLVQDLVDAVIDAVRAAALDELAGGLAPVKARRLRRLPSPAPVARERRPRSQMHAKGPRAAVADVPEPEASGGIAITDPAAVLAFVASLEKPPAVKQDDAALPEVLTPSQAEAPPASAAERLEVAARPGEEVLRSAAGAFVLRRRSAR